MPLSQGKFSRSDYLRKIVPKWTIQIHYEVVAESKVREMLGQSMEKSALILIRSQSILTLEERTLNL